MKAIFQSKRFLSLFLALVMILGMLPMNAVTAVAADANYTVTVEGDEHVIVGCPGYAVEGEKVTLDICPNEGWALNTLSVMCGETPVDVAADYSFIMPAGDVTVTVTTKDDDGTTYTITVAETLNGKVETSVASAAAKETVTVTITPDSGYALETLTFNGTAITANEEGTYTFPMPWANVTVNATFVCASHNYINGICSGCGYQPAVKVTVDNYKDLGFTEENYEGYVGYYAIGNAGQLYWFAQLVNGVCYDGTAQNLSANAVLIANIDLENRVWYPIGVYQDPAVKDGDNVTAQYNGTFDGNGHTVSNFTAIGNGSQGLLGYCTKVAVIKNVGVINATVSGWNAGAVVAYQCNIENCYAVNCAITATTTNTGAEVVYAGAVGGYNCYSLKNCFAYNCTVNVGNTPDSVTESRLVAIGGGSTSNVNNCYYYNVTTNGTFSTNSYGVEKTVEQFASGEVAYLLNGDQTTIVFKQTLGEGGDAAPNFTGKQVFLYEGSYINNFYDWVNSCTITVDEAPDYNGDEEPKPAVTVTNYNGEILTENTDYTLAYNNDLEAGTGTVTVTGIGTYGGTVESEYSFDVYGGQCGESAYWKFDYYTGALTITGTGDMAYNPWWKKHGFLRPISSVEISEGITSISWGAFEDNHITEITIPSSVTMIDGTAFNSCRYLEKVTFAENSKLETIGICAFANCKKLTSIQIPAGVTTISREAFIGCDVLATVTFAENSKLESIGDRVFGQCNLTSIEIPASVESLGGYLFVVSGVTSVYMTGDAPTDVHADMFKGAKEGITVYVKGATANSYDTAPWTNVKVIYVDRISADNVTLENSIFTYDGNEKKPAVTVTNWQGTTLTENVDYTVAYSNNIKAGTATVTVTGKGDYKGTANKDFAINYLTDAPDATVSGTVGSNGWYTSAVTLAAPDGYTISEAADGTWSESVSYEAEQNKTVTYYLKNANGEIAQKTFALKIDLGAPTAEYQVKGNGWREFINFISFGIFCKDSADLEIKATDTMDSSVTVEYYISSTEISDASTINGWNLYTEKVALNPKAKNYIYICVTDDAGNYTVYESGVVVFSDSVVETNEITFTKTSEDDVTATVVLNNNTVKAIYNGTNLIDSSNYSVAEDGTITFEASYLDTLAAGDYTLTVYYNPLWENYVDKSDNIENDEAPATTKIVLKVVKAEGSVSNIQIQQDKVYDGSAITAPTYNSLSTGAATIEYKKANEDDAQYTTTAPKNAGDYVVRVTVAADGNYNEASNTATFTIKAKEITVTIQSATSVYGDEIAELKATDNGIIEGDSASDVYSLATTATKASDIGTYNITGTDTSDNYDVTFENGTNAYEITQRELTVTVVVADKQYDGLNNATITSAKLNNVANGDQIVLSSATATFASVDVANRISINLTPFSISGDKVGNYRLTQPTGITANITNGWNPVKDTEYTTNGSDWRNTDFVITAKTGYALSLTNTANGTWVDSLTGAVEGADSSVKFYIKNITDGTISEMVTESYKLDKVAPTGTVEFVERKAWQEFVNTITFGLFYDSEVTVKVSADDKLSGVEKIEYASSNKAMTLAEVKAIENWTEYTDSFGVTYEEAKTFVYFVRITDNAGNVTYLSSDGAEYDNTDPVISGVENGKTYYTTQKVTVTDKNINTVTVNNVAATTEITLDGNVDTTYTIVATDKAENKTTVTVTMKPISDLSKPIDNVDTTNVNSSNEQVVDGVKAAVAAVDTTNATDAEKEALKAITDKATELEKVIDDTKAEIARITEEMAKYDGTTVNSDDAAALEQLGKDIKALTDAGNLTESERTALTADAADVAAMQKTVSDTTAENNRISDKVDDYDLATVTSDDKADLEELLADINKQLESTHLTDEETSKLNGEKKAVEDLLTKIQGTDELIDKLTGDVDGYSDETVKSTDKDAIEQIIKDIDALLETENLTEDEEKALEDAKAKAQELLDTIDNAADATESENIEKVKDVTAENVTPEDKTDLEKAKEDLEKALEDYGDNYTEDEKKAIEDEIKRIDDALEVIGNVENVEELIDKLPDTIKKDDADAIKAADDAYNALTAYEKSLVDDDVKTALTDAKAALAELNKPADTDSPQTGDNSNMFLWIALLFISGGAVITLTVVDRKRRLAK